MDNTFYALATKSNFNKALNHFFAVNEVVEEINSNNNLADVLNEKLSENELTDSQILPIIGAVIKEKFKYSYDSFQIPSSLSNFTKICEETSKWTALDLIMVYFDQNGLPILINPKNMSHWSLIGELLHDTLIVLYTKYKKDDKKNIELEAIKAVEEMLSGKDVFINKEFIDESVAAKKVVPVKQQSAVDVKVGAKNVTPKYSIQVTNELFHNGNVEAWKRILESYKASYPSLDVTVFYEDELINDINTLFKWGKVKHGGLIFFQISGDTILGVSKLKKYLFEGASPRYEQFLHLSVGKVLKLF